MSRVTFVPHQAKQVLLVDMTNCTPQEASDVSRDVQASVTEQPKNSVLMLVDVTGAKLDKAALDQIKKAAAYNKSHVRRSAMIGAGKEHNALREGLKFFAQREYQYFNTKEEALAWLVS